MLENFKAIVVEEQGENVIFGKKSITQNELHKGDVLIKVAYSSVNFKDMLAVQKNGGVIRTYPMIPGIDLSGVVVSSEVPGFKKGQEVIVTGYEMGMSHTGGFSEYARIPHEWVVPLPEGLSLREAMVIGTAGFTAGLSVLALQEAGMGKDKSQNILVTGGSGGVGSIALTILKKEGYENIIALTRKDSQEAVVKKLGAARSIKPDDVFIKENPTLLKAVYHYVLDTVGGDTAANLLPQIHYAGAMSMCGNAGGIKLSTNVLPFILRGISLLGIDSAQTAYEKRQKVWSKFATDWHIMDELEVSEVNFDALKEVILELKEGRHIGRTIVKIGE